MVKSATQIASETGKNPSWYKPGSSSSSSGGSSSSSGGSSSSSGGSSSSKSSSSKSSSSSGSQNIVKGVPTAGLDKDSFAYKSLTGGEAVTVTKEVETANRGTRTIGATYVGGEKVMDISASGSSVATPDAELVLRAQEVSQIGGKVLLTQDKAIVYGTKDLTSRQRGEINTALSREYVQTGVVTKTGEVPFNPLSAPSSEIPTNQADIVKQDVAVKQPNYFQQVQRAFQPNAGPVSYLSTGITPTFFESRSSPYATKQDLATQRANDLVKRKEVALKELEAVAKKEGFVKDSSGNYVPTYSVAEPKLEVVSVTSQGQEYYPAYGQPSKSENERYSRMNVALDKFNKVINPINKEISQYNLDVNVESEKGKVYSRKQVFVDTGRATVPVFSPAKEPESWTERAFISAGKSTTPVAPLSVFLSKNIDFDKVKKVEEKTIEPVGRGWSKASKAVARNVFGVPGSELPEEKGWFPGEPLKPEVAYPSSSFVSRVARGIYKTSTTKPLEVAATVPIAAVAGFTLPVVAASGSVGAGIATTTQIVGGSLVVGGTVIAVATSEDKGQTIGELIPFFTGAAVGGYAGSVGAKSFINYRLNPSNVRIERGGIGESFRGSKSMERYVLSYDKRATPFGKTKTFTEHFAVKAGQPSVNVRGQVVSTGTVLGEGVRGDFLRFQEGGHSTSYLKLVRGKDVFNFETTSTITPGKVVPKHAGLLKQFFSSKSTTLLPSGKESVFVEQGHTTDFYSQPDVGLKRYYINAVSKPDVVASKLFDFSNFKFLPGKKAGFSGISSYVDTGSYSSEFIPSTSVVSSTGGSVLVAPKTVSIFDTSFQGGFGSALSYQAPVSSGGGILAGFSLGSLGAVNSVVGSGNVKGVSLFAPVSRSIVQPTSMVQPVSMVSSSTTPTVVSFASVTPSSTTSTSSVSSSVTNVENITNVENVVNVVPTDYTPINTIVPFWFPGLSGSFFPGEKSKAVPKLKKKLTGSPSLWQFTVGLVPTDKKALLGPVTGFEKVRGGPVKKVKVGSVLRGTLKKNSFTKVMSKPGRFRFSLGGF